jgi:hypothetical protein
MSDLDLKPGSVNLAYDPRYWVCEPVPVNRKFVDNYRSIPVFGVDFIDPPLIFRTRFVLPIRGAGNQ